MCERITRVGSVFMACGIHARKCCGQKKTVRSGGGKLEFRPDVSKGARTIRHFTPLRCGSTLRTRNSRQQRAGVCVFVCLSLSFLGAHFAQ